MDRAHHLQFCKQCKLRNFDRSKGIVCSLTREHADFFDTCESYEVDEIEAKNIKRKKEEEILDKVPISGKKTNMGIIGGILAIVGAVVWFFAGLAANRIFFYPFLLVVYGVISIVNGINTRNKAAKQKYYEDVLDDTNFD